MPGETVTLTVTSRGPGTQAGLLLTATRGTFFAGNGTRLLDGDVVQVTPRPLQGGVSSFVVQWRAPGTPGGVRFTTWTVLGNGDQRNTGDTVGEASLDLTFGCEGQTFFRDFDDDGVGSASNGTTLDCSRPPGFAATDGDCDDFNGTVLPGANERCNARDDDCDGLADEGLASASTWPDLDGDGFGDPRGARLTGCTASARAPNDQDCDDSSAAIRPGGAEVCNQRDDDCDGRVDENVRARCGTGWCAAQGATCDPTSCQPGRPLVERCNFLDDDCDGLMDEGALCPTGQACIRGACVETALQSDETDVVDGPEPAARPMNACATTGPAMAGLALLLLLRRLRS